MRELWVPLSGAIANQRQIDVVSNNIANINTAGFKKDNLTFKEHLTALDKGHTDIDLPNKEWRPEDFYRSYGAEHSFVQADATYSDFSQGRLAPTGNNFDLAIQGQGFFEILTPNGIRYTRNGTLGIDRGGNLVTSNGFPVLSKLLPKEKKEIENNSNTNLPEAPVPPPQSRVISVGGSAFTVANDGRVYIDNKNIAELSLVEFKDVNALTKEGSVLFINKDEGNILKTTPKSSVNQGFIEESNVNSIVEMTNLIKANRNFESIQKVIKTYDQMAGQTVNEITKF